MITKELIKQAEEGDARAQFRLEWPIIEVIG